MTATAPAPVAEEIDWQRRALDAEMALHMLKEEIEHGECCDGQQPHEDRDDDLIGAIKQLHEQAHGGRPFRVCIELPCRHLDLGEGSVGPAPTSLPFGDHLLVTL